jgi:hypothetical protein
MHPNEWDRGLGDKIGQALFVVLGFILAFAIVSGFIALHVFIIITLAQTGNDVVFAACGEGARAAWGTLLAEILVTWTIVAGYFAIYDSEASDSDKNACNFCAIVSYTLFSFCISIIGVCYRYSVGLPAYMDVLRAHSAGMDRALLKDFFDVFWIAHLVQLAVTIFMCYVTLCCDSPSSHV